MNFSEEIEIGDITLSISADYDIENGLLLLTDSDNTNPVQVNYSKSGCHNLRVDGKNITLYTARTKDGVYVWHDGKARFISKKARKARGKSAGSMDKTDITPKTPGVVVKVLVHLGDEVQKGQELVIISAMKMETPLVAGFPGTIAKINCSEGDNVSPGDILIDIEKS